jgi:hypothetical protein
MACRNHAFLTRARVFGILESRLVRYSDRMAIQPKIARAEPEGSLSEKQLAQRRAAGAKAREALRAKNNKPASGFPATGMPAMGPGWGGEAKGRGAGPEGLRAARAAPRRSRAELDALAEEALDRMIAIAFDPSTPGLLKVHACEKVLNLIEGPPPSRVMLPSGEIKIVWPRRRSRRLG